ncbi:MAG: hypothetical protein ACOYM3_31205, partial [Terrimicrobiaceae bacterium]
GPGRKGESSVWRSFTLRIRGDRENLSDFFQWCHFFRYSPRLATGTGDERARFHRGQLALGLFRISRHDAPPGKVAGNPHDTTVNVGTGFTGW